MDPRAFYMYPATEQQLKAVSRPLPSYIIQVGLKLLGLSHFPAFSLPEVSSFTVSFLHN